MDQKEEELLSIIEKFIAFQQAAFRKRMHTMHPSTALPKLCNKYIFKKLKSFDPPASFKRINYKWVRLFRPFMETKTKFQHIFDATLRADCKSSGQLIVIFINVNLVLSFVIYKYNSYVLIEKLFYLYKISLYIIYDLY